MKRRVGHILFALLLVCLLAAPASALTVPPVPVGTWVYDGANVLSSTTENRIDNHLAVLKEETGAEIAVVTVDFAHADMEDLAYGIINQWGVGSDTRNNGVVILFSTGDDDYYVTMGYGIEDVLDAGTLRLILDDYTEPKFAVQDYDGAMGDTFVAIYNVLADYYGINTISSLSALPTPSGTSYYEGDPYEPYEPYTPSASSEDLVMAMIVRLLFWILIIRFILWVPCAGTVKYWGWWLFRPRRWAARHPNWHRFGYRVTSGPGPTYTTYHGVHGSGSSYRPPSHSSSYHSSGSFHSSGGSWSSSSHSSSHSSHSYSSHSSSHSSSHGGFSGGGGHGGGAGRGR